MTSKAKILRIIKEPKISLERITGHGYWIFIYDAPAANVYETESVYCMRLNDMSAERWAEAGLSFLAGVKERNQIP